MQKSRKAFSMVRHAALATTLVLGAGASYAQTLCNSCGVVTQVRSEARTGRATALGTVGGALVGGMLGDQVGKGDGNTAATIVGAVGGAYAGREIEKRHRVRLAWITTVRMRGGDYRSFTQYRQPNWGKGTVVRVNSHDRLVRD